MSTYVATLTFDLPSGDGIDAATAATLLGERLLAADAPDFRVTGMSVTEGTQAATGTRRVTLTADELRRLLADLDAAEHIARLAEESEAGWRREADELAERLAAVSALADEWQELSDEMGGILTIPAPSAIRGVRAALTTTPTPAAEAGRREESGR